MGGLGLLHAVFQHFGRRMCHRVSWVSSYVHVILGGVVLLTCVSILFSTDSDITTNVFNPRPVPKELRFQPALNQNQNTLHPRSSAFEPEEHHDDNDDAYFRRIQDVASIHTRFTHLTLDSCNNSCESSHVHCDAREMGDWLKVFEQLTLNCVPLFSDTEYFFPWELQYMKTPPLEDINTLPSLNLSAVYFRSQNGSGRSYLWSDLQRAIVLVKNSPVTFRVDLVDGYGRPRGVGGDEVRAWLKGEPDGPTPDVLWATARVKDFGNGTYDVIATPTWTGVAQLKVAVSYPREYIRLTMHHFRIGVHRFVFGRFQQGDISEVTVCHSTPNVPGRPCVCNMTHVNGLPYYCGKPLNPRLSCDDWRAVNTNTTPGFKDMTSAEYHMDKEMSRHPHFSLIQHGIALHIEEGANKDLTLPPCRTASRRTSWTMKSPRGVWSQNRTVWNSLVCREPEMTSEWMHDCLKSTTVWMIGDSNIRFMAILLSLTLGCGGQQLNNWPANSICRNDTFDITVRFRPHEYPLYVAPLWMGKLENEPVVDTLSSIPSTGEHIVVLHYYLHFSASHLNVLVQRLTTLKDAIVKLLSRNPRVLIAIRGPHTSAIEHKRNHMFCGDVLGAFIREIHIETFRDLQDSIVFLDGWDMSISYESLTFHPLKRFVNAMWRTLLAYRCD